MKDINSRIDKEKGVIYLTEKERTAQLIKPILRGRDIKRYSYEWAGLWIINVHNGYTIDDSSLGGFCGSLDLPHCEAQKSASHSSNPTQPTKSTQDTRIVNVSTKDSKTQTKESQKIKIPPIDIDEYPTLKAYFDKVASEGKQGKGKGFYNRDDKGITPYNLRNCAYLPEFAKPKIVYSEIVREPQFYLDNGEFKFGYFYAEATSFILSGNKNFKSSLEYLLGLLHSKLCTFAFKEFYAGGGLGESGYRYKKAFLENLPIPKITQSQEAEFIAIVQEIIECKKSLENFNNEVYPHCNTIKTHEVQTSKALSGWGIDKGEGATSPNSSPSPLSKKEQNATLKDLESRLDSMVFSLYGLDEKEINIIVRGGAKYSLAYLLLACVESQLIVLVKSLCKNFELELKEAFKFCGGLQVPNYLYEGKIIYPETTQNVNFMLDKMGYFLDKTAFMIKGENLTYLNAVLTSKTIFWYLKQICSTLGASGFSMSKIFVEKLPVVETHKIDSTFLKEIESLANEILESNNSCSCHSEACLQAEESNHIKSKRDISGKSPQYNKKSQHKSNTKALESRLDSLIYQAYGLNEKEINLIESELSTRERERERENRNN